MAVDAPIAQMSLAELRRSALVLIVQIRGRYDELQSIGEDELLKAPDGFIEARLRDILVMEGNLNLAVERIAELEE